MSSWDPHRKDLELKPKACQHPQLDRILRAPGPVPPEHLTLHGEHPPAKVLKVDSPQVIGIQIFHKFFHLWEERCDRYKLPRNASEGSWNWGEAGSLARRLGWREGSSAELRSLPWSLPSPLPSTPTWGQCQPQMGGRGCTLSS